MFKDYAEILSKDNDKIKNLRKLNLKKYRDESGLFAVENFNIVLDAAQSAILPESLFITQEFYLKNKAKLEQFLKNLEPSAVFVVSQKIAKTFSNLEEPSGLTAIYKKRIGQLDMSKNVIYLNGISDPGNLGTILRSALAFDLPNLVLDENCADVYGAKTVNAAKDAIFKLNLKFDKNLTVLKQLKESRKIIATRLKKSADIKSIKNYPLFCLVLGSEAKGVSEEIQKLTDVFLRVPIGRDIESLNVASAAAIIFYLINN
ncbi:MAG: RNA methyltransferase [Candidatus Komeilibacteria bacterium]|nr:RNA methyltransferase [Candidatus Komeilibacteria bacterium]